MTLRGDWSKPDEAIAAVLRQRGAVALPFNQIYGPCLLPLLDKADLIQTDALIFKENFMNLRSTALFTGSLTAPALHASSFTPEHEQGAVIRESLIANPKILDEVAKSWEKQNEPTQQAQLGNFIKGNKDVLFNSAISLYPGARNPKLTLVLFTDYNCSYCKQFDPRLTKLLKAYPDDLGLVIRLLPFKGQTSAKAAQYSLTLWQQDPSRFLTLHDKLMNLMSKQGMLTEADIINKVLAATGNVALKPAPKATRAAQLPPLRHHSGGIGHTGDPDWQPADAGRCSL